MLPRSLTALPALALLAAAGCAAPAAAQEPEVEIRLPALFSDGMVLQRDTTVTVWGWTEPLTEVAAFGDWPDPVPGTGMADEHGRFEIPLSTPGAGGPYNLVVVSDRGKTVVADVLLGEVWVCSGQSNME